MAGSAAEESTGRAPDGSIRTDAFARLLIAEFYADADMIRRAIELGRFVELRPFGPEAIECAVATAEDTILRKLEWYPAGGETSEPQSWWIANTFVNGRRFSKLRTCSNACWRNDATL